MFKRKQVAAKTEEDKAKELEKLNREIMKNVKILTPEEAEKISYPWRMKSMPLQRMRDKLARDSAWPVLCSWTDYERKELVFTLAVGPDATEDRRVPFEVAAKHFNWDGFNLSEDKQSALPFWHERE